MTVSIKFPDAPVWSYVGVMRTWVFFPSSVRLVCCPVLAQVTDPKVLLVGTVIPELKEGLLKAAFASSWAWRSEVTSPRYPTWESVTVNVRRAPPEPLTTARDAVRLIVSSFASSAGSLQLRL